MNLTKIKIYQPCNLPGGGASISNDPYDSNLWGADLSGGASRSAIRDKIESMGLIGNTVIVDDTYGDDSTGSAGNILKPFKTHQTAMNYMISGVKGLVITMPGTYTIANPFGFPLRDQVDHFIINATINLQGMCYGTFMIYPMSIQCKIYGNGIFNNQSSNTNWAQITPYVGCDIEVDGMRFIGAKQFLGQQGLLGGDRLLKFKNCYIESTNNRINPANNAGNFIAGSASFDNCYLKGYWSITSSGKNQFCDYKLKFSRCSFQAIDTNSNGFKSSLGIWDYNGDSVLNRFVFDDCKFKSNDVNLNIGEGYNGIATNKYMLVNQCQFVSTVGWIKNENPTMNFKLVANQTLMSASGTYPVNNLLSLPGMAIEPNLEVSL